MKGLTAGSFIWRIYVANRFVLGFCGGYPGRFWSGYCAEPPQEYPLNVNGFSIYPIIFKK
jgi:hypothetical protein